MAKNTVPEANGSMTRREFARRSIVLATVAAVLRCFGPQASAVEDWLALQEDPVRGRFAGPPQLDIIAEGLTLPGKGASCCFVETDFKGQPAEGVLASLVISKRIMLLSHGCPAGINP